MTTLCGSEILHQNYYCQLVLCILTRSSVDFLHVRVSPLTLSCFQAFFDDFLSRQVEQNLGIEMLQLCLILTFAQS